MLVGTTAASACHAIENPKATFDTTVTRQDGHDSLASMVQLQREAEDVLARYGNFFEQSTPGLRPALTKPLQPRSGCVLTFSHNSFVQRTTRAVDCDVVSLRYPTASKRTRVSGCHLCAWPGCNKCKCTQMPSQRHIVSEAAYSVRKEGKA